MSPLALILLALSAAAPLTQCAVDVAGLPGGERILGIRLDDGRSPEIQMLVRRAWLERHSPQLYERFSKTESEEATAAWEKLRERLLEWQTKRAEDKRLSGYITRQLETVEKRLAPADENRPKRKEPPSLLLLVRFPKKELRTQQSVSQQRRQLLALAWQHELDEPESLSALDVTAKLKELKVDPTTAQVDLSDRVPPQPTTDRQWSAKTALVEFSLLGAPHFQGTGDYLVEAGDGAPQPGLEELLGGLLGGQLEELLNPGGKPAAAKDATDKATGPAEKAGRIGVRITQMNQSRRQRKGQRPRPVPGPNARRSMARDLVQHRNGRRRQGLGRGTERSAGRPPGRRDRGQAQRGRAGRRWRCPRPGHAARRGDDDRPAGDRDAVPGFFAEAPRGGWMAPAVGSIRRR